MSTTLNIDLLNQVEEILNLQPSRFYYPQYVAEPDECGTVGCIAGHLVVQNNPDARWVSNYTEQASWLLGLDIQNRKHWGVSQMLFHGGSLFPLHETPLYTWHGVEEAKLRIAVVRLIPLDWFEADNNSLKIIAELGVSDDLQRDWSTAPEDVRKFCIAVQELETQFFADNDIDPYEKDEDGDSVISFDFSTFAYRMGISFNPDAQPITIPNLASLPITW